MVERFTRRALIGSLAVLPAALSMPAIAQGSLQLPKGPMRLSRRLSRGLHDGKSIVVNRVWHIHFKHTGRGVGINGYQISAIVDAPANLEPMARFEERRLSNGFFPILLDSGGAIMASGPETQPVDFQTAMRLAEKIMKQRGDSGQEIAHHRSNLALMRQANDAVFEQLPSDLFFPRNEGQHMVNPVRLPDGSVAEFEMRYSARPAPGASWLDQAERQIITRIGATERRSSDRWTLSEAP